MDGTSDCFEIPRPSIFDRPRSRAVMELASSVENVTAAIQNLCSSNVQSPGSTNGQSPMIDNSGEDDFSMSDQGIFHFDSYNSDRVPANQNLWIPSFHNVNWNDANQRERRQRAQLMVTHNLTTETWSMSEHAWEADAWSDVFNGMRNDPCLTMDKHLYNTLISQTPTAQSCNDTRPRLIKRRPDTTFGLRTFSEQQFHSPVWVDQLYKTRLENLLLHHECGLLSDPRWGKTDLIFPFAVYEAKGLGGDCREARRQACSAAAVYLDMLDALARNPGRVGSKRRYQTSTSHEYQVFAITSFGAYWHVLVGHRRSHLSEENTDTEGLNDNVYIFQKIWSGRVADERTAWELLALIDEIHLWAITEFRTFVIDHLRLWNQYCLVRYLLELVANKLNILVPDDSRIKTNPNRTRLPGWTNHLGAADRLRVERRAKQTRSDFELHWNKELDLLKANMQQFRDHQQLSCSQLGCCRQKDSLVCSQDTWFEHLQLEHGYLANDILLFRQILNNGLTDMNEAQQPAAQQGAESRDEEVWNFAVGYRDSTPSPT